MEETKKRRTIYKMLSLSIFRVIGTGTMGLGRRDVYVLT